MEGKNALPLQRLITSDGKNDYFPAKLFLTMNESDTFKINKCDLTLGQQSHLSVCLESGYCDPQPQSPTSSVFTHVALCPQV